jgi:hypothetical protein
MQRTIAIIALLLSTAGAVADECETSWSDEYECVADSECGDGEICLYNDCVKASKWACTVDDECDDNYTCEDACVLYDFEQMQCGTHGLICSWNSTHLEAPEDCIAFCEKLAPCYDTPGVKTKGSGTLDGGECHQVSQYTYDVDKVLDCKLDCAMILDPPSSVGTEEDIATSEAFGEAYAAAMACVLQAEVTTCGEADTFCADEWAQVMTLVGPAHCTGECETTGEEELWSDRSNQGTALAAVDVGEGDADDPGSSCSAGPMPSPFAGFLLLLSVLAFIALRTKSPGRKQ